jgi:hypothetical protein
VRRVCSRRWLLSRCTHPVDKSEGTCKATPVVLPIGVKRTGSPEFLLRGLAAVSIDNDRSFQNFGIVLGELYRNATEHGLDASSWEFRCRDRFALDSLHHHRVRLAPGAGPTALRALNRSRQPPPCHPPSFLRGSAQNFILRMVSLFSVNRDLHLPLEEFSSGTLKLRERRMHADRIGLQV